jgi:hypothetical protein
MERNASQAGGYGRVFVDMILLGRLNFTAAFSEEFGAGTRGLL